MMVKTPVQGEYDVFYLEQGLSSLKEHPEYHHIYQNFHKGQEKSAVAFLPYQFYNPLITGFFEGIKVRNFHVHPEVKVSTLLQGLNPTVPIVLLQQTEEWHVPEFQSFTKLGNLEVTEQGIELPH